jgi:hypothetical protein
MALEIYVEAGCATCDRAWDLADEVARSYPALSVEVIDISNTERDVPEAVFAVPTYILDGDVISLGNPSGEELRARLDLALAAREPCDPDHTHFADPISSFLED